MSIATLPAISRRNLILPLGGVPKGIHLPQDRVSALDILSPCSLASTHYRFVLLLANSPKLLPKHTHRTVTTTGAYFYAKARRLPHWASLLEPLKFCDVPEDYLTTLSSQLTTICSQVCTDYGCTLQPLKAILQRAAQACPVHPTYNNWALLSWHEPYGNATSPFISEMRQYLIRLHEKASKAADEAWANELTKVKLKDTTNLT